jgi:AcrR family transcriptional regulator
MYNRNTNTRETILKAAMAALVDGNFTDISMQSVAQACGVTKPTLYYYYSSKKGLFVALASHVMEELKGIVRRELDSDRNLRDSLISITEQMLAPKTSPDIAKVHLAFIQDPNLRALVPSLRSDMNEMNDLLSALFGRAVTRGEIRKDLDIVTAGRIFASVLHGYISQKSCGGPEYRAIRPQAIVDVMLHGID